GQPFFSNFEAALNHERTAHDHNLPALKHDRNADGTRIPGNQLQTADETCWDKINHPRLTSEGLRQWEMHAHVDHVFDLVPFWQRGMDAAEKGEVLRLEEFLDKMEGDGGWRTANEVLGMLGGKVSPSPSRGERARDYGGATWGKPNRDDWAASRRGAWESNTFGDGGWGIREEWAEDGSDVKLGGRVKNNGWDGARVKTVRAVGGGGREELHHFVDAIARQEAVNEERRKQMHLFFEMPVEQKIQKIEETIRFLRMHAAS
ncbi:hypothetical protein OG21DRAFT_1401016, partial [Imleria badia]